MNDDVDCFFCGERLYQPRSDAARVRNRNPRVEADYPEMRYLVEGADDLADPARSQQKRVAAGDNHFPDLRALPHIAEGAFQCRSVEHSRFLAHDLSAKTEAAIDRAQQDRLQQYAVRMTMNNARHRRPTFVANRVGKL